MSPAASSHRPDTSNKESGFNIDIDVISVYRFLRQEESNLTELLQKHPAHLNANSLHNSPVTFRVVHPATCVLKELITDLFSSLYEV